MVNQSFLSIPQSLPAIERNCFASLRLLVIIADYSPWVTPFLGVVLIYAILFATGYYIYGKVTTAVVLTGVVIISAFLLKIVWQKLKGTKL